MRGNGSEPAATNRHGGLPASGPVPATATIVEALAALDDGRRLAEQLDRPDLGRHLRAARQRLADQLFAVAVVGEFKRGKSTLVNALLQTDVCPVDADIVTTVPTVVRHGDPPSGTAILEPDGDGPAAARFEGEDVALERVPVDVDRLRELVSELADPAWRRRLRSVEVGLPHRLLRTGLCLVDTPGVGGLDSAHGVATAGALGRAAAVVFVTDASQELTAPEVEFLRTALDRCPIAVCVVTKTDLYPEWERIVELDRGHLGRAGIEIPVIGVSSFLRLRAWRRPELNAESGFGELFDWLRDAVVESAARSAVDAAARDLRFAREQLETEVTAEQQVLQAPETGQIVVQRLRTAKERTARLATGSAGWQQALGDGVEDLFADVKHDLQERLRLLNRDAEAVIDQGDPREAWPDVQLWLQRQLITAATENYALLSTRADELAVEVAESFAMESEAPLALGLTAPLDVLRGVTMTLLDEGPSSAGLKAARLVYAGRTAVITPTIVAGAASIIGGTAAAVLLSVFAPIALAVGVGIGRRMVKDERTRQLTFRRQQAKMACRRYLDEALFVIGHDCSEALRRTRRELRDEFQARASVLHASSERALDHAQRAATLDEPARARRSAELAERSRTIERVGGSLGQEAT